MDWAKYRRARDARALVLIDGQELESGAGAAEGNEFAALTGVHGGERAEFF